MIIQLTELHVPGLDELKVVLNKYVAKYLPYDHYLYQIVQLMRVKI